LTYTKQFYIISLVFAFMVKYANNLKSLDILPSASIFWEWKRFHRINIQDRRIVVFFLLAISYLIYGLWSWSCLTPVPVLTELEGNSSTGLLSHSLKSYLASDWPVETYFGKFSYKEDHYNICNDSTGKILAKLYKKLCFSNNMPCSR